MKIDYTINENKINSWLDELEQDRKKLFDDIKNSKSTDKIKEAKIQKIENIQKNLLTYKKIICNEKDSEKIKNKF
jgi:hypothetical protein